MLSMLEKRKDESESIEKFRSILMAAVIGALLLFAAPTLVGFLTGVDAQGYMSDGGIFSLGSGHPQIPEVFVTNVFSAFQFVLWIARVIIILFIVMSVIMLRVQEPAPAGLRSGQLTKY